MTASFIISRLSGRRLGDGCSIQRRPKTAFAAGHTSVGSGRGSHAQQANIGPHRASEPLSFRAPVETASDIR